MNPRASSIEIETAPLPGVSESEDIAPPWQVLVLDDPVNLMSFVTLILRRVFGYSESKATALMLQVHQNGRAIVWTGEREKAELYVQQLHAHQLLASMEPVE